MNPQRQGGKFLTATDAQKSQKRQLRAINSITEVCADSKRGSWLKQLIPRIHKSVCFAAHLMAELLQKFGKTDCLFPETLI